MSEHAATAVAAGSSSDHVDAVVSDAEAAFDGWATVGRSDRAHVLRVLADGLESHRPDIVEIADEETSLGRTRLEGELSRTTYQLGFFADVIEDGGYLEATIDHAGPTPMGPRPDLRRMLVPIGPVAVFSASNFPLAFSVPGGDTASALAAGCSVVVKAHSAHPETSRLCASVMGDAITAAGAPHGLLGLVEGRDAGIALVEHPAIQAVGFTGSTGGGRALYDRAAMRPEPIPFYGELGGVNPLIVTPEAAAQRGATIARDLAASITQGAGQFCTKPGLVFLPVGAEGDRVRDDAADAMGPLSFAMLSDDIRARFVEGAAALGAHPATTQLTASPLHGSSADSDAAVQAALLEVDEIGADGLDEVLTEECFGPLAVVIRYRDRAELLRALAGLPAGLTATVHAEDGDRLGASLLPVLARRYGRLVWNGYPTGVSVAWSQHHGGPWPATTSQHTSVGATAIRRWLRPVAWQGVPASLLPPALRDEATHLPRRVDGQLYLAPDGR